MVIKGCLGSYHDPLQTIKYVRILYQKVNNYRWERARIRWETKHSNMSNSKRLMLCKKHTNLEVFKVLNDKVYLKDLILISSLMPEQKSILGTVSFLKGTGDHQDATNSVSHKAGIYFNLYSLLYQPFLTHLGVLVGLTGVGVGYKAHALVLI